VISCASQTNTRSQETAIGMIPKTSSLDLDGLDISESTIHQLFHIDQNEWRTEVGRNRQFLSKLGTRLPAEINLEMDNLLQRLDDEVKNDMN